MKYGRFYGTLTFRLYCYDKIVHRLSSISPGIRWRSALGRGMHTRHARLKTVFYLRRLRYYISVGKKNGLERTRLFQGTCDGNRLWKSREKSLYDFHRWHYGISIDTIRSGNISLSRGYFHETQIRWRSKKWHCGLKFRMKLFMKCILQWKCIKFKFHKLFYHTLFPKATHAKGVVGSDLRKSRQ